MLRKNVSVGSFELQILEFTSIAKVDQIILLSFFSEKLLSLPR